MIASSQKSCHLYFELLSLETLKYHFFFMKGQNMEYDDAIPMIASSKNYINSNYEI